jgi:hypothetical protein
MIAIRRKPVARDSAAICITILAASFSSFGRADHMPLGEAMNTGLLISLSVQGL